MFRSNSNDGINSEGLVGDAQYLKECSWDTEENLKSAA